jgi:hypothetical protein
MLATATALAVVADCGGTTTPSDGGPNDAASDMAQGVFYGGCPACGLDAAVETSTSDADADADSGVDSGDE